MKVKFIIAIKKIDKAKKICYIITSLLNNKIIVFYKLNN